VDQTFKSEADLLKNDIVNFTQKLIQTPSLSGNEGHLAELILAELEKLGYDEAFIDDIGNVVGIIYGKTPEFNIMFSSHMDHNEPGDYSLWKHEPYSGEIIDNAVYGIGASDAKGAIASQVYGGVILKKTGLLKKGNYIVSFSVQESSAGCFGTKYLYEHTLKEKNINVNFVVLGNATALNIYLGQRGRAEFEVVVYGRTNHSIVPWLGINAVHKIIPVIKGIEDLTDNLPSHPMLDESTLAITSVRTLPDRPNTIPDKCILKIDRRFFPNEPVEEVKGQIQAIIDRLAGDDSTFKATLKLQTASFTSYKGYSEEIPKLMLPFLTSEDNPLVQRIYPELKKLQESINFGSWYFNTDGGYPSTILMIPTIGYSPGDERYYSTPFENVLVENLIIAAAGNATIYSALLS
jgi:putative selenium metabolism hydrolase